MAALKKANEPSPSAISAEAQAIQESKFAGTLSDLVSSFKTVQRKGKEKIITEKSLRLTK